MPRPSHSSRFYHPHNIGRGVQPLSSSLCILLQAIVTQYYIILYIIFYFIMGPPSYMRSVVDRNVVMRSIHVFSNLEPPFFSCTQKHTARLPKSSLHYFNQLCVLHRKLGYLNQDSDSATDWSKRGTGCFLYPQCLDGLWGPYSIL